MRCGRGEGAQGHTAARCQLIDADIGGQYNAEAAPGETATLYRRFSPGDSGETLYSALDGAWKGVYFLPEVAIVCPAPETGSRGEDVERLLTDRGYLDDIGRKTAAGSAPGRPRIWRNPTWPTAPSSARYAVDFAAAQ